MRCPKCDKRSGLAVESQLIIRAVIGRAEPENGNSSNPKTVLLDHITAPVLLHPPAESLAPVAATRVARNSFGYRS
jgi:hypothetical protein